VSQPTELPRLEWYKRASSNLRKYAQELETALALRVFADKKPTEYHITEINRRLADLDRLITDAERTYPPR
jgi:hypothetical protein